MEADLIKRASEIARIKLTEQEVRKFSAEIDEILDLFSTISEANTKNQELAVQPTHTEIVLREDEPGTCLSQGQALSNSKHNEQGFIKGPRTV